jgi:hypothetical protein
LESKVGSDFKPHPEGIYPAVCVDVMDLGLVETEWQGQRRLVNKVRVVFETEHVYEDGRNATLAKTFTASLHPKSKLAEFLGKWRGRPVVPGESIDLTKLIMACCTLVISHQQNMVGRTYASIDAISKPTKKVVPSGGYDPVLTRQRMEEWKAREAGQRSEVGGQRPASNHLAPARSPRGGEGAVPLNPVAAAFPKGSGAGDVTFPFPQSGAGAPHSKAPAGAAAAGTADFDPEVGF